MKSTITRGSGSFVADGFRVGDVVSGGLVVFRVTHGTLHVTDNNAYGIWLLLCRMVRTVGRIASMLIWKEA
jgi:hypothetical protein